MRQKYRVLPSGDDWMVKKDGNEKASILTDTKQEAIEKGRELAQKAELGQLFIHKRNGVIQTEWTYGKDPRKYPS